MVIEYFLEWVQTAPVLKRVSAAGALVRAFLAGDLTLEEREDIEAAITTLTEDPAPSVRQELAECFGAYPTAPRHIMASLADDSLDISVTVLSQSPVFHDAELISYAQNGSEKQQIAITCRPWLSETLVYSLCEIVCRDAAYAILVNPAAELSDGGLHTLAQRFGEDTEIRNLLNEHPDLSSDTRLLLIERLGSALGKFVKKRNWVEKERADKFLADAFERASIIYAAKVDDADVRNIVRGLIAEEKLTVAYLLRSLCMGNISLLAHALSELSGLKMSRIESVLNSNREAPFKAIYDRAGLPVAAFGVFVTALSKWRDLLATKSPINRSRLPFLVTREVLATYTSGQNEVVDGLLVLLRKLAADAARESAKSKASEIASRSQEVELVPDVADVTPIELSEEPVIDIEQFSESLQLELDQINIEDWNDNSEENFADMDIVEIASSIANEQDYISNSTDDMYSDIYDFTDEEFIDGFSRAA